LPNTSTHFPSISGKVVRTGKTVTDCLFYGYAGNNYYNSVPNNPATYEDAFATAEGLYSAKEAEYNNYNTVPIEWEDTVVIDIVAQLEMLAGDEFTITINGALPKTNLEKQIVLYYELTNLKQYMDGICYAALEDLANDTAGLDITQYRTWIGRFNTLESEYLLADSYLALGEFTEAEAILDTMPSKFPNLDEKTHQNYLDYLAVLQEYALLGEDTIPFSLITELVRLSNNNDFVAVKARSFGEITVVDWTEYYSYAFTMHPACVCSYDDDDSRGGKNGKGRGKSQKSMDDPLTIPQSDDLKSKITIKPNPTTGTLHVTSSALQITDIQVFDIYGKQFPSFGGAGVVDISHLANGMYFIKITTEDGRQQMKKFVKE
jgi:hypothetical protein